MSIEEAAELLSAPPVSEKDPDPAPSKAIGWPWQPAAVTAVNLLFTLLLSVQDRKFSGVCGKFRVARFSSL
ncbi:hypothetical protein [Nocardia bhagyanarayanae]|uniref:hypothetical protein n=1 Tax=Nocardia bhagyanarayanae TaxID=1215925 RepID=UPI00114F4B18|nr:hypothetical protein [Nocardia bhagyanarayanae]